MKDLHVGRHELRKLTDRRLTGVLQQLCQRNRIVSRFPEQSACLCRRLRCCSQPNSHRIVSGPSRRRRDSACPCLFFSKACHADLNSRLNMHAVAQCQRLGDTSRVNFGWPPLCMDRSGNDKFVVSIAVLPDEAAYSDELLEE